MGGLSHIKGTQTTWVLHVLVMGHYIRACTSGGAHTFGIASNGPSLKSKKGSSILFPELFLTMSSCSLKACGRYNLDAGQGFSGSYKKKKNMIFFSK